MGKHGSISWLLGANSSGINGRLGVFLESPILAALVSFTVGATSLLFVTSALGIFSLAAGKWDGVPLVYFTGGLIGAFIVSASSFLAQDWVQLPI